MHLMLLIYQCQKSCRVLTYRTHYKVPESPYALEAPVTDLPSLTCIFLCFSHFSSCNVLLLSMQAFYFSMTVSYLKNSCSATLTDSGALMKTLDFPSWYWSGSMLTDWSRWRTPCFSSPFQEGQVALVRMAYLNHQEEEIKT